MLKTDRLIEALGGRGMLVGSERRRPPGTTVRDEDVLIERLRSGLPYQALEAVATRFGIGSGEMLRILRLPHRTLARRKRTGLLSANESDRLVRVGRIGGLVEELLGSPAKAGRWLREPNPALGGTQPLHWLDNEIGAREVEQLLSRIAHGVSS